MSGLPDILERIIEVKRAEVAEASRKTREFEAIARGARPPRDFEAALRAPGLSVIAEVKKASPSAGDIVPEGFVPAEIAGSYEAGGADAVSVLTDREFFKGAPEHLRDAAAAVSIPVMRKDFIIAPCQVFEARALGADSFLLIAAVLEGPELLDLMELGRSIGMEPLVESHDADDLEKALSAGARIFGVNARNLRTFEVDTLKAAKLAKDLPSDAVKVAESGVKTPSDASAAAAAGFDAILVGETLARLSPAERRDAIQGFKGGA